MPESLTESFCERCGTRYTFKAPTSLSPLRKARGFAAGLKNYVMSSDSLDEALSDALHQETESLADGQLSAFNKTFNFCMTCRQYACRNCWNDAEGRCLTCAPTADALATAGAIETWPDRDVAATARLAELTGATETRDDGGTAATAENLAWPDLLPPPAAERGAVVAADEPFRPVQEPAAGAQAPEPVALEWPIEREVAAAAEQAPTVAEEPVTVEEPVRAEATQDEPSVAAEPIHAEEPAVVAEEPAVVAEVELPEPPVPGEEVPTGEPRTDWEVAAEPAAAAAHAQDDGELTSWPPHGTAPYHGPAEEDVVVPFPQPAPAPQLDRERQAASASPDAVVEGAPRTIADEQFPELPPERIAAALETPEAQARRAQLELLGIPDPGREPVAPQAAAPHAPLPVLPTPDDPLRWMSRDAARAREAVWAASSRQVASAATVVPAGVQDCSSCGLAISASARFCRRCGQRQLRSA